MMPVFASMVVQTVEVNVPYVWSLLLDPDSRVVIRKIDVTQTLSAISKGQLWKDWETNKPPKAKTTIRPSFCRRGRCSEFTTGIGKANMAKSPRMLAPALAYQKAVRLMQVPGVSWSKVRAIGVHWKTVATMLATAYPITKTRRP